MADNVNFCGDSEDGEQWDTIIRSPYSYQVSDEGHLFWNDSTNPISSEQNPQMIMNQTAAQTQPSRQRQSAELTPPDSQSKRKISEITAVDSRTSKKRENDRQYRLRLKERNKQKESDLKTVEAENAELKRDIESLKNERLSLSQELSKFKKENEKLKQKLRKKKEKIQQQKLDLKAKEDENGTVKDEYIKSLKESNALVNQHFETQSNEPALRRSEFILARSSTNFTGDFVDTEGRSMHSNAVALLKVNK